MSSPAGETYTDKRKKGSSEWGLKPRKGPTKAKQDRDEGLTVIGERDGARGGWDRETWEGAKEGRSKNKKQKQRRAKRKKR